MNGMVDTLYLPILSFIKKCKLAWAMVALTTRQAFTPVDKMVAYSILVFYIWANYLHQFYNMF